MNEDVLTTVARVFIVFSEYASIITFITALIGREIPCKINQEYFSHITCHKTASCTVQLAG